VFDERGVTHLVFYHQYAQFVFNKFSQGAAGARLLSNLAPGRVGPNRVKT
jgi:hypothetical protein